MAKRPAIQRTTGETARICHLLGMEMPTDPAFQWSIHWLELHGKRFCVHFGFENAIAEAERIGTATVH